MTGRLSALQRDCWRVFVLQYQHWSGRDEWLLVEELPAVSWPDDGRRVLCEWCDEVQPIVGSYRVESPAGVSVAGWWTGRETAVL